MNKKNKKKKKKKKKYTINKRRDPTVYPVFQLKSKEILAKLFKWLSSQTSIHSYQLLGIQTEANICSYPQKTRLEL